MKPNNKKSKTDWEKLKNLTDKDIELAASNDPDNPILSKDELSRMKRVKIQPTKNIDVHKVRKNLHLSQSEFADCFGISLRTLQEWEQGRREPNAMAKNFLKIIAHEPKTVLHILQEENRLNRY